MMKNVKFKAMVNKYSKQSIDINNFMIYFFRFMIDCICIDIYKKIKAKLNKDEHNSKTTQSIK